METERILKELRLIKNKYEGKQVGVGELRLDYMADACIRKIEELSENQKKPSKPKTRYDKLIEGGVEALAEALIIPTDICGICNYIYKDVCLHSPHNDERCKQGILEYLNQEVEDE